MLNILIQKLGYFPIIDTQSRTTYKSPFNPSEKTPSFFVFLNKKWDGHEKLREFNYKCNSTGKGGNIFDFVMKYYSLDFVSARNKLKELLGTDGSASSAYTQNTPIIKKTTEQRYKIMHTTQLQSVALVQYLEQERKISFRVAERYLSEIHYAIDNKNYFALSFINNSGGREIRNRYFKACFGKKDISTISPYPKQSRLKWFEGFTDFLSYIELNQFLPKADYLILNSLTLIDRALQAIGDKYESHELYLDNDKAGDKATHKIINILGNTNVSDKRTNYQGFEDLNAFWVKKATV